MMKRILLASAALTFTSALAAAQTTTPELDGLVNVNIQDVLQDIAVDLNVEETNIPVTLQVPVSVAANVCDVDVNVLSAELDTGEATCVAVTGSQELTQIVQQEMTAGDTTDTAGDDTDTTEDTASDGSDTTDDTTDDTASGGDTNTDDTASDTTDDQSDDTASGDMDSDTDDVASDEEGTTDDTTTGSTNSAREFAPGQQEQPANEVAPGQQEQPANEVAPGQMKKLDEDSN